MAAGAALLNDRPAPKLLRSLLLKECSAAPSGGGARGGSGLGRVMVAGAAVTGRSGSGLVGVGGAGTEPVEAECACGQGCSEG